MTAQPAADATFDSKARARLRGAAASLRLLVTGSSERSRLQRNAITAFGVRVASAAILYLSQIALARWMGSFEYGIYVFVWTWVLVLGGLSTLGAGTALIRMVPSYREAGDLDHLRGVLRAGRVVPLAFSTLVTAAGLLALWLWAGHVSSTVWLPLFLALFCVPMVTLSELQDGIGRSSGWMGAGLMPHYVVRPLLVLVGMLAAHLAGLPMVASTAAGVALLASWLAAVLQTILIGRELRSAVAPGPRRYDWRTWIGTALPLLVINGCELLLQNTDVLVVSRFLPPQDVAIYFAAAKTMSLVLFVHYAVGSAVANRYAALNVRGDREALKRFIAEAVNWTFWPSLAAAVAILAAGRPLLWLFGPDFLEAYPVMFILAVGFLFRAAVGPAEFLLNMLGEQVLCAAVLVATAVLNLALAFALVPNFGMYGAALATALSLSMAAVLNYIVARRRLELEIAIWSNLPGRVKAD